MKEKIGISGSHGFIGSHLIQRLGPFMRLGREGGDIPVGTEIVFDLSSYGNLANQTDVEEIYRANLGRVIHTIWSLSDYPKYMYISTSSVSLPVQTPYSRSKRMAEEFLQASGFPVAIVRPYTIVGVGEPKIHLIPKLIDSCLNGTEMPFVPEPTHDFLDVEDFVEALITIKDKAAFEGEIYEVGRGEAISNDTVRQLVQEITGKNANLRYADSLRSYDMPNWKANPEAIIKLGWKPKKDLRRTITEMYERATKYGK